MAKKYLKMGVESTFGTAAATTPVRATDFRLTGDNNVIFLETIDSHAPYDAVMGTYIVRDSFTMLAVHGQIDMLLEAVFGNNDAGVFTLDVPKSLTVEVGDEHGDAYKLSGVLITRAEFTFDVRDVVKVSGDYIARTMQAVTHSYEEATATKPYICWNTTVSVSGSSLKAKEFTMSIERGIRDDSYVLGSRFLDAIEYGVANISGRCTLIGSEVDEFRRAIFGSASATSPVNELVAADLEIVAKTPDNTHTMTIDVSNAAVYTRGSKTISGSDPVSKTFEWRAVGDNIQIVLS